MEISGIYTICNKVNSKFYLGSTENFDEREEDHFHNLKHNEHHNKLLQEDYNKFGRECFEFNVFEQIQDLSKLKIKEDDWVGILKPEYNSGVVITKYNFLKERRRKNEYWEKNRIPVLKYDSEGNFICRYNSLQEAKSKNSNIENNLNLTFKIKSNYLYFKEKDFSIDKLSKSIEYNNKSGEEYKKRMRVFYNNTLGKYKESKKIN